MVRAVLKLVLSVFMGNSQCIKVWLLLVQSFDWVD